MREQVHCVLCEDVFVSGIVFSLSVVLVHWNVKRMKWMERWKRRNKRKTKTEQIDRNETFLHETLFRKLFFMTRKIFCTMWAVDSNLTAKCKRRTNEWFNQPMEWNSQEIVVYPPNASTTTIHFQCTFAWLNRQPNVCFLEFLLLVSITSTSALSSSTGNSFADERHNPQKPLVFRECENWIETMLDRRTHSRTH